MMLKVVSVRMRVTHADRASNVAAEPGPAQ